MSDGAGVNKIDTALAPAPVHLGALGISGLTAYFGLLDVGRPEPGQTVVVSGAAGSVGSIAGQIARIKGCRAVGIAGGAGEVPLAGRRARLRRRDRLQEPPTCARSCKAHAPDGVDVYFDNVGGDDARRRTAPARPRRPGRALRRGLAVQRDRAPRGPVQLHAAAGRTRDPMTGFVIFDYADALRRRRCATRAIGCSSGELRSHEQIEHGDVGDFPDALLKLFRGENTGKLILALGE